MTYKQTIYIIPKTNRPKTSINFSPNIKSRKLFYQFKHFHNLHLWLNAIYDNYHNGNQEFNTRNSTTLLLRKQDIQQLRKDILSDKFIKLTTIKHFYIDHSSDSDSNIGFNLDLLLQFCNHALKPEHQDKVFYYVCSDNVKYFY